MKLGQIVLGFVSILVGIFLAPTVATEVTNAVGNFSGAAASLWPILTLLWVIVCVGIGIGMIRKAVSGGD